MKELRLIPTVDDRLLIFCLAYAALKPGIFPVRGRNWVKADLGRFQMKAREAHWIKNTPDHG